MEPFQAIELAQPRDFSKKMNATIEFIRQNFKALFKCLLFIAGPPVLLSSILIGGFYGDYMGFITGGMRGGPLAAEEMQNYLLSAGFWLQILGAAIFGFVAGALTLAVIYNYILEYDEKKTNKIEVNDIWIRVRKTIGMYMGTMIMYAIAMVVSYFVILIPMFIFALAQSPVLIFFGAILIFVGIIYVWINFSLIFIIRAYEKIGFFSAVSRSFYLIKGKWWSTFGIIFITGFVQSTISSLFLIPWYIGFFVKMMHTIQNEAFEEPSLVSELVNDAFFVLYFLVSFLLYVIPLVAISFQYFNLVELKESRGLMSKIDTIGQAPTESTPSDEHY